MAAICGILPCPPRQRRQIAKRFWLARALPMSSAQRVLRTKENIMARGDKSSYTSKQKRKAEHIEEGYEKRGVSKKTAAKRAWATVNKQDGGGKKSGSGAKKSSARKKSAGSKSASKKSASKKSTAKKSTGKKSTAKKSSGGTRKKSAGRKSTRSRRSS